ncbi:unnamed protein product [Zymoseptoria tritici ST99CH_1A5]|nr:unnamed protein product [Zymoseptoria tritici ST99CH_3D7]SMR54529.1 unnamed protein product [Zymoseptoria tritici ST99CH_1E4]SMR56422.1 unnamed protein product [Zymoseptoria tritici ST99CH_3D1]SMY25608.1 unnamed protein product [Zymoseptoria tritici ST99CH_1A5]
MHFSHILPYLIAGVSAIDLYASRSNTCGAADGTVICRNVNPTECCPRASGNAFRSIEVRAIPTSWRITGQAFNGGDCRNVLYVVQSNGRENICLGNSDYSGGSYIFQNLRRSIDAAPQEACPASGCNVRRGNEMVFEGGPSYNMSALDESDYDEL